MAHTFDRVARALGDRSRRVVLTKVHDQNPLSVSEIESVDATMEAADRIPDPEQSRIALVHTHLPMLDSIGYVDWDRDTDTIVKGDNWEEIVPYLELLDDRAHELPAEWP